MCGENEDKQVRALLREMNFPANIFLDVRHFVEEGLENDQFEEEKIIYAWIGNERNSNRLGPDGLKRT